VPNGQRESHVTNGQRESHVTRETDFIEQDREGGKFFSVVSFLGGVSRGR
jgi:hypothetical protein